MWIAPAGAPSATRHTNVPSFSFMDDTDSTKLPCATGQLKRSAVFAGTPRTVLRR